MSTNEVPIGHVVGVRPDPPEMVCGRCGHPIELGQLYSQVRRRTADIAVAGVFDEFVTIHAEDCPRGWPEIVLTADDWYTINGRGRAAFFSNRSQKLPPQMRPLDLNGCRVTIDGDPYMVRSVAQSCAPGCECLPSCGFELQVTPLPNQT